MPKKNKETPAIQPKAVKAAEQVRIVNLTGKMFPVPYRDATGSLAFLQLRLQTGRQGQDAPTLSKAAVIPAMKDLERKGFIRIENV